MNHALNIPGAYKPTLVYNCDTEKPRGAIQNSNPIMIPAGGHLLVTEDVAKFLVRKSEEGSAYDVDAQIWRLQDQMKEFDKDPSKSGRYKVQDQIHALQQSRPAARAWLTMDKDRWEKATGKKLDERALLLGKDLDAIEGPTAEVVENLQAEVAKLKEELAAKGAKKK